MTADKQLEKQFKEWDENWRNVKRSKKWTDGVKAMEEQMAKHGCSSSILEVYSPPRVTGLMDKIKGIPGLALDLTTEDTDGRPWDFNCEDKREKAKRMVRNKEALLVIGSPMCAAFSRLQHLNFGRLSKEEVDKVLEYGKKHLEFCMELYRIQLDNGLYFLHEHPASARS